MQPARGHTLSDPEKRNHSYIFYFYLNNDIAEVQKCRASTDYGGNKLFIFEKHDFTHDSHNMANFCQMWRIDRIRDRIRIQS